MNNEIWRKWHVRNHTGLSETTIWRLERAGDFPARRQLSNNAVGWLRSEVEAWMVSREPSVGIQCKSNNDAVRPNATQNTSLTNSVAVTPDKSYSLNIGEKV
jgi:prophage regulatory protein